ncbi:TIGR04197 family type VII secretion effector [Ligilactobacillus aviarius]|uniref:TIGR04197 family type VII secretion effector n=1 Tax=Ligilactobacillus aviarius TaxID=1606 RepID=UPI0024B9C610|nr:TIGR04197 family type VII secretion effector [Ligilactobacillus aviarius]
MASGRIKVTPSKVRDIASEIGAVSVSYPGINKDTETTVQGNKKASQVIDEIGSLTNQVTQIQSKFASDLNNYASGIKEADKY